MSGTPVFDFAFHTRLVGGGQTFELDCRCQSQAKRLAIVGESGSGKSLTLQLLAGLLRPQAGYVRIGGTCYGDTGKRLWLLSYLNMKERWDMGFLKQDLVYPGLLEVFF